MPRKPRALILDSWAIVSYLEGLPAAEKVANIIADAHDEGIPLFMCVINASEIWSIIARRATENDANRTVYDLQQLAITLVDADWGLAQAAARIKIKYRMSLLNCFAAALAHQKRGSLVTGDSSFREIGEDLSIMWV